MPKQAIVMVITILVLALGVLAGMWDVVWQKRPSNLVVSAPIVTNSLATDNLATNSSLAASAVANKAAGAPDFTFSDILDKRHGLSDFQGKLVILNFWATWCAPCVKEFPSMLSMMKRLDDIDKDAVLLAISVDEDPAKIRPFFARHNMAWQAKNIVIGIDPDKGISQDLFQSFLYPETYILAPNPIDKTQFLIIDKIIGAQQWDSDDMIARLKAL